MKNSKVAIIGAGIMGLTAALRLAQKGFRVKVFESKDNAGGMAAATAIEGNSLEIFYHHFFKNDKSLVNLCKELGLSDKIAWRKAKMGYFSGGRLYDFGTPISLFRFSPLSLRGKWRFGKSILKIKQEGIEELDHYTAEEWLIKNAGEEVFDTIWKPLLIQKFGEYYKCVSMAWLWHKMMYRSLSRRNILSIEKLGYLNGSLKILFDKLVQGIIDLEGSLVFSSEVKSLKLRQNGGYEVSAGNSLEEFDAVVSTVAPQILAQLSEFNEEFKKKLKGLKYLGVISILLVLKKPLSKYYWLNIGDNNFPFGLAVEHTNFCNYRDYNGKHLVYLSKYTGNENAVFHLSDEEMKDNFVKPLQKINRELSADWIEKSYVFREAFAQPVFGINYLNKMPDYLTPFPGIFWGSLSHIYPEDRGVNASIREAERLVNVATQFLTKE